MRFKIEKMALVDVLQDLVTSVPSKTTLQVLANFLISLKGDELSISATDLDISMRTVLKVKGEKDGELTVNARKLFEIVRELPSGAVQVDAVNNVLQISIDGRFITEVTLRATLRAVRRALARGLADGGVADAQAAAFVAAAAWAAIAGSERLSATWTMLIPGNSPSPSRYHLILSSRFALTLFSKPE